MENVLVWVMTPANMVEGFPGIFYLVDGGSMLIRNNHIRVSGYTVT